jgi:hypothetical protein
MNIFTANQVNQVYVLKSDSSVVTLAPGSESTKIPGNNSLGSIGVGKSADGKSIYFKHYGAGGVTRSDLIDIANIIDIKATPASKMARNLSSAKITLNPEALSDSKPVAGQDFVLRIQFQNPVGMSPDNQYWKFGVVHSTASMTASNFYLKLASSIAKNMSREAVQLVKVYVTYSTASKTEITANSDVSDTTNTFTNTYTGVLIEEVEQDWILGVKQQKPTIFTVNPTWVNAGTASAPNEVVWGDVIYNNGKKVVGGADPYNTIDTSNAPASAGEIVNSKLIADYEYFYMGERGDQYRMVGFPNYIPTTYLVDPTAAYGYDLVTIHFAYVGANHSVQKSEKDITFAIPRASSDDSNSTKKAAIGAKTKSLVDAIEAVYPVSYTKAESDAKYAAKSNG